MAKRKPPAAPGIPEWVVTYGDMMSLLLCFFILLSAFSELKKPKEFQKVLDAIQEAFGSDGGLGIISNRVDTRNSSRNHLRNTISMTGDMITRSEINEQNMDGRDDTTTTINPGTRQVIGGPVGFEAASAELSERAKEQLREVARIVGAQNRTIEIRGHAYGLEDKAEGLDYDDLSYARARAAKAFLATECGVRPELLSAVAVGNSEPRALDRVDSGAGASNRRVEVIVTERMLSEVHPDPDFQGVE
ncbi:MAG: OmpA family protein [Phycisphaeraceae bacterium]|nr:OmpA family protein [Phycisphaeraceae bacterium]